MTQGVSVIVCTYNGAERLSQTLKHLAFQEVPEKILWEIILVDNASTDDTANFAKNEWEKYNQSSRFRIIKESVSGKINALKTGFTEAKYEYVVICDDDNWLNPVYVKTAAELMQSDPLIAVAGGCGVFEPEQPMRKEIELFKKSYINGTQKWVSKMHWVYGAGSVCRKRIFLDLIFNWDLITPGRIGSKLNGGEDVEFCLIAYLSGYKIIANDNLLFKHFVPLKRQNFDYIYDLSYWVSYSNVLLNSYFSIIQKDRRTINQIINEGFLEISQTLAKQLILQSYKCLSNWRKPSIDELIAYRSNLGAFYSFFRNKKRIVEHHNKIKKILVAKNLKLIEHES